MVHNVDELTVDSQYFESDYSNEYFTPLAKLVRTNLALTFLTSPFLKPISVPLVPQKIGIPLYSSLFWGVNLVSLLFLGSLAI